MRENVEMIGDIVKVIDDVQISLNIILLECILVEYTLVNPPKLKRNCIWS